MKILHCNTFDIYGGASRAAYRLHKGLQSSSIDSHMLVQNKRGDDWSVIAPQTNIDKGIALLRPVFDALPLTFSFYAKKPSDKFSVSILPGSFPSKINTINPDIVHLHWLGRGFFRIEELAKLSMPIVWTFHDMWPFTGGCHIDRECGRYQHQCGFCPQLDSNKKKDVSYRILQRKIKVWSKLDLSIVTPSTWMADCAKKSSLFEDKNIRVIPNGLDLQCYKPIPRDHARNLWNLPQDKKLILCGAMNLSVDSNKGSHLLKEALKSLDKNKLNYPVELVLFGSHKPENPPEVNLKTHYIGKLHDDVSLASLYSASDVFVCPSMQENLPNMVAESLACGTPVVAFNTGGLPDMIDHLNNGYLAECYKPEDLARGIQMVLEDESRYEKLCTAARQKAENDYDTLKVSVQYKNLYLNILCR